MSEKDGGPAFPQALNVEQEFHGSDGMTLRDYFAGQVMSTMIGHYMDRYGEHDYAATAESAYLAADAMLKERAK